MFHIIFTEPGEVILEVPCTVVAAAMDMTIREVLVIMVRAATIIQGELGQVQAAVGQALGVAITTAEPVLAGLGLKATGAGTYGAI